jgi:(S)-mandelate dehydrogenase
MLNGGLPAYENLHVRRNIMQAVPVSASLTDDLTWADVRELRKRWPGKLIIKGILHPEDAKLAVSNGADGIIVSNHGGRNLDHSIAPIEALPEIAAEIGHKATVLLDSGIRRGSDIAKALAMGATAVLVGRAPLYGTAVAGQDGAEKVIGGLKNELLYTMAMLGCNRIADLQKALIHAPHIPMPDAVRAMHDTPSKPSISA